MSAVGEYRAFRRRDYHDYEAFMRSCLVKAEAAIAELEAENKAQVEKTIASRQETHLEIIKRRQAEDDLNGCNGALVKAEAMLRLAHKDLEEAGFNVPDDWLADLRRRATMSKSQVKRVRAQEGEA